MEASLLCASERARLTGTPPVARSGEESVAICRVAVSYHGGHPAAPCPTPGGSLWILTLRLDGLLLSEESTAQIFIPRGDLCGARLHERRSWDWRGARWQHHGLDLAIDFSYWSDSPPATLWLRAAEGQGAGCAAAHRGIVALIALAARQLPVAPVPTHQPPATARQTSKQLRPDAPTGAHGRQILAPVLGLAIVLAFLPALLTPSSIRPSIATTPAARTVDMLATSPPVQHQISLGDDEWEMTLPPTMPTLP